MRQTHTMKIFSQWENHMENSPFLVEISFSALLIKTLKCQSVEDKITQQRIFPLLFVQKFCDRVFESGA